MAAHPLALAQLPSVAGVYRLRRVDRPGQILGVYPAEAGVRQTVERLSRQTHLPLEPYDDPAAPARLLWRGRSDGLRYDVSGVVLPPDEDLGEWAERLMAVALTFESIDHDGQPTDDTGNPSSLRPVDVRSYWYNTVGPLPFGHVTDLPRLGWKEAIHAIRPGVIYALLNWQIVPFVHSVLEANPASRLFGLSRRGRLSRWSKDIGDS